MLGIGEFFRRIQDIKTKEIFVRTAIQDSIKKHTSVHVPIENISFASGSVVLKNINQTARSVVFIRKANIIKDINGAQTVRVVTDIR